MEGIKAFTADGIKTPLGVEEADSEPSPMLGKDAGTGMSTDLPALVSAFDKLEPEIHRRADMV
jgi:hypothetical protein